MVKKSFFFASVTLIILFFCQNCKFRNSIFKALIVLFISTQPLSAQTEWKQVNGPYGGNVNMLKEDTRSYIYALGENSNLYISKNLGYSWDLLLKDVTGFGFDKNNFCYTINESGDFRIYDSTMKIIKDFPNSTNYLYEFLNFIITNNGFIFAERNYSEIMKSTDNGESWNSIKSTSNSILAFDELDNMIMTNDNDSIYRSTNYGEDWQAVKVCYGTWMSSVVYNKVYKCFISAANDGKIYLSDNGEISWFKADSIPLSYTPEIYADNFGNPYLIADSSIYYSTNGGRAWIKYFDFSPYRTQGIIRSGDYIILTEYDYGIVRYNMLTNKLDISNYGINGLIIKFVSSNSKGNIFACTHYDIFRSKDAGNTWQKLNLPDDKETLDYYHPVLCSKGDILFTANIPGVYRSTDDGDTWSLVFNKDSNHTSTKPVMSFSNTGRLYMADGYDLFYSDDNGSNWNKIHTFTESISCIAVYQDKYIFAGSFAGSFNDLNFSEDSGMTFKNLPISVPEHYGTKAVFNQYGTFFINLTAWMGGDATYKSSDMCQTFTEIKELAVGLPFLKVDENNVIYAGGDLKYSGDVGSSWHSLVTPDIENLYINDICFINGGAYIGSSNYGLFKTDVLSDVPEKNNDYSQGLTIIPNPASDFIILHSNENSNAEIFDIFGEIVMTISIGQEKIDVSSLTPGLYFVRVGDKVIKFVKILKKYGLF